MRVAISSDAAAKENCFLALNSILRSVEKGWHVWEVLDPESLENSAFIKQNRLLEEMHMKAAMSSAYPRVGSLHSRRVVVVLESSNDNELVPDIADNYLNTPLKILMENRISDGTFLDAVLDVLAPPEMTELLKLNPSPLEKDSPGGNGQLPDLVDEYVDKAKSVGFPPRVVVFTDSDARFPDDVQKIPKRIHEKCIEKNIPFCLLRKCNIENYIPDEVFNSWCSSPDRVSATPFVAALKMLNPVQRDHFHLKGGFKKLDNRGWTPEEQQLYSSVSSNDKKTLYNGYKGEPIELLERERSVLTAEAFRRRDGKGDLDRLVQTIAENL